MSNLNDKDKGHSSGRTDGVVLEKEAALVNGKQVGDEEKGGEKGFDGLSSSHQREATPQDGKTQDASEQGNLSQANRG